MLAIPMDFARVYDVLNELLAAEWTSLLPRLVECSAFVPTTEAIDAQNVEQMASAQQACVGRLAETLLDLGGEPRPFTGDIAFARFHYVDLDTLLPYALAGEEALASKYQAALDELSGCPQAIAMVAEIGTQHRVWAEALRKFADKAGTSC